MTTERTLTFSDPDATARFASELAPLLGPGDVILLYGGLGSGKTHFARALIRARLRQVGRVEDVPSPTYTLVQEYTDGVTDIWHCDLYRLGGPEDAVELGLEQAFSSAICLVEWPERLGASAPAGALSVHLSMTEVPGVRVARLCGLTPHWAGLVSTAMPDAVNG